MQRNILETDIFSYPNENSTNKTTPSEQQRYVSLKNKCQ